MCKVYNQNMQNTLYIFKNFTRKQCVEKVKEKSQ